MKAKFKNQAEADALQLPKSKKQEEFYHSDYKGLLLRINPTGEKRWVVKYTFDGKRKKITLPVPFGAKSNGCLNHKDAVKEYHRILGNALDGIDHLGNKVEKKASLTVYEVMKAYNRDVDLKEDSRAANDRVIEKDIKSLIGQVKATDIERRHVKKLAELIYDRGAPVMANRTLELMQRAFTYAYEEELIKTNTFPSIKRIRYPEETRERYLLDHEIGVVWPTFELLSPNMRDIHRLLLLTGQRTQDVCSMKKSEINEENCEWLVPALRRDKNRKPNLLPLGSMAWEIIRPRLKGGSDWVFPSNYNMTRLTYQGKGHTRSLKKARGKVIKISGVESWTGHDLRRTCRTLLSRCGVTSHIAERVIGHTQKGVEGIYDRFEYYGEKKDALGKLEMFIKDLMQKK